MSSGTSNGTVVGGQYTENEMRYGVMV